MRAIFARAAVAIAATGAMGVAGLAAAQPAMASLIQVPCNTASLASAISGASNGDVLQLANSCTYLLTRALPNEDQTSSTGT